MARIAGVDIPDNKRGEIGLTYIFGIGRRSAQKILSQAKVSLDKKVKDWNDEESNLIRSLIAEQFRIEGSLKSEIQLSIKRLMDIGCYPWPSSPQRFTGAWTNYEEQRTHTERQAQDRSEQKESS